MPVPQWNFVQFRIDGHKNILLLLPGVSFLLLSAQDIWKVCKMLELTSPVVRC